jgi:hypothetical protein
VRVRPAHPPECLIDHTYLDNGRGVLFCVAGSCHTPALVVGCPYYLRDDIVDQLGATVRSRPGRGARPLVYGGQAYFKISLLAAPGDWGHLLARLDPAHGIDPLPTPLLATLDRRRVAGCVEPRTAARDAARSPHGHGCLQQSLIDLLGAVGDPGNEHGHIGFTGSAALDSTRLCDGEDLDLLVYPSLTPTALENAVRVCGGQFLADLKPGDPEYDRYAASRFLPATPVPGDQRRLWSRRRDVLWLGGGRMDVTQVPARASIVADLPYALPDLGPCYVKGFVAQVEPGYPLRLMVVRDDDMGVPVTVLVTARGYDSVFMAGDHLAINGRTRGGRGHDPFVTVEDAPGHRIALRD